MTTSSSIRMTAGTLGVVSGLFGAWHAYGALKIGAPMGTIGLLSLVALLQIVVSTQFVFGLGRKADAAFLVLFGVASIAAVDRFLWTPVPSLLVTPAAFVAGLIACGWRASGVTRPPADKVECQ